MFLKAVKLINNSITACRMTLLIPEKLYTQILEHVPIPCIDFVLYHQGKVLLTYRTEEPAKGLWWIQGGRIFKHENFSETLQRLAQREIGSEIKVLRQIGAYEFHSEKAKAGVTTGTHDVAIVFLAVPINDHFAISLDKTHSQHRWIDRIEEGLHPYIKQALKDSGVFGR